ncbi:putative aminotransferase [Sclerotinia borealis F-4128]|uniref:Putative aminotransferase n=1 Tax=Sclerotinia borealis (strain F-4128) TaxID=1432307 RepID=W9CJR4_SCLBF|nr:putative aminotransferase [Sclerotinia borealis F-4128]
METNNNGALPQALTSTVATRIQDQRVNQRATKALPTFYRNLEEALDVRRASHNFYSIVQNSWQTSNAVDLCSGDILGLGSSPERRSEFLAELARCPGFTTGSSGVRLMDGEYSYLEEVEREIAAFHGVETGLIVGSAYEANIAVWTAIPRPGDVILYDEFVHASTHEGIRQGLAMQKVEFPHSDVDAFRSALLEILVSQPLICQGKRSVLVAVESIYSMDGDVCPLQELVGVAQEIFHSYGNIHFVVDEAHSVGVIGPKGAGLVCELGLQDKIAVVVHSFGKAMGATGAIILGNKTIKSSLANFGRSIIYTTSPSFPFVAAIKSGYTILETGRKQEAQERIQQLGKTFFESITSHATWSMARDTGLISVPLLEGWRDRSFLTHIITISTRERYTFWLYFALLSSGFCTFPVNHPIVPLGHSRLRVILHATNTKDQVRRFVKAIFAWVEEMLEIEEGRTTEKVSIAARDLYTWMRREGLTGYGMK